MDRRVNPVQRGVKALLKSIPFTSWGGRSLQWMGLPDERNYQTLVGDGLMNSIVGACVGWIARTFPEAPPAVWRVDDATAIRSRVPRHPLVRLLTFPTAAPGNPGGYYSGVLLWMASLVSWVIDGNAYWIKARSGAGRVVQLWYTPHWLIEPAWALDGSNYISHYEYRPDGKLTILSVNDVVHFRYGLDPENPRKGRSPLKSVLREIYTDEEAARFSASILKNLGVPGVLLSPAKGSAVPGRANQTDVDAIKSKFKETFGGDNRGEPMVMTAPTDVTMFGFSPQQLDLSALRKIPEERITAALGLPSAVVGFGSGLSQTKVGATMRELRDQAWQSNLIPTQRIMGAEIQTQLLPEFETDIEGMQFGFDLSKVHIFEDSLNLMALRWQMLTNAKIAKRSEARAAFDLPVDLAVDDIYIESTASATSGSQASTDPAREGEAQRTNELAQQLHDLQNSKLDETLAAVKAASEKRPEKIEAHVHFDKGAIPVDARTMKAGDVILQPGTVQLEVDARTTVAPGAVQVDTPVTIAAGAVQVTNEAPKPTSFDIVRNADGITGVRAR